ncbi:hypothetical protein N431DRAFT_417149 [Stipitochalara longipes BDJ]|nr:hypothetical protein N431DRAFT_417149 [Stipitochalara longipes BDJ]
MSKEDIVGSTGDAPDDTVATATNPKKTKRLPKFVGVSFYVVLCLGWIAPIVALLVLNFKSFIVGASVSCAVRSCNDNAGADNATRTSEKLDQEDHDILGALQLVAKALEIWFIFLAGSLVFDLTMLLARRRNGIPIRYFTLPIEFGELKSFLSKSLFTSAFPQHVNAQSHVESHSSEAHGETISGSEAKKTRKSTIFCFLLFVVAISIVCNLMGPATAVLLIPTLVWRVDPISENRQAVTSISASGPPTSSVILYNCSPDQFASGQYSCADSQQGCLFQEVAGDDACVNQGGDLDAMLLSVELQGIRVPFTQTIGGDINFLIYGGAPSYLVPNLQTLQYLADDVTQWKYAGEYDNYTKAVKESNDIGAGDLNQEALVPTLYGDLRNAQQVQLQRQGPGYLSDSYCESQMPYFSIEISEGKVIRCYDSENLATYLPTSATLSQFYDSENANGAPVSTMCIRTGSGWGLNHLDSQFFVANHTSPTSRPVTVNTYASDTAIYLNTTTYHCATNNATTDSVGCDWDSLFSEEPSLLIKNLTINPWIVEYIWSDGITISWCSNPTFLRYPTYVMDTSLATNPLSIANLFDNGPITKSDEPIFVHPDWSLAGWSVDRGDTIPADQARAQILVNFLGIGRLGGEFLEFVQDVVTAQILSQIDYSTEEPSADHSPTPSLPILDHSIRVYVYAYTLQSGTSILGVVIAIAGCVIVLIKMLFGVVAHTKKRDTLEFLEIALEQEPPGLFVSPEAKGLEKVRFRFDGDEEKEEAKFTFPGEGSNS